MDVPPFYSMGDRSIQIEHILPRAYSNQEGWEFAKDIPNIESKVHSGANLTLLSGTKNLEVRNYKFDIMNCIIVDDEPLAREAIEILIKDTSQLNLMGMFNNAIGASKFMEENPVDLIFLDIQMPGITGIEFAHNISKRTLVIFTTAYTEYALDSYEVDAIDYLIKPVDPERFHKAVNKAIAYYSLLLKEEKENIEAGNTEYFFVKSERRYFKINYKDILFIEGLKDYVIIQLDEQRVITRMNLKNIFELLPKHDFLRVNKSYIVNTKHIDSFDNNDIFIKTHEIAIGNTYRDAFFEAFMRMG